MVWCATGRLDNPSLRPAFRVRRGRRAAIVDMTRHVGSRASGYPPDFVPFRRRAGALFAGAPRRHRSLGRSRPPSLWGALFGNVTKSGGCTNRDEISRLAQTRPDGKQRRRARPSNRPTPESDRSQRSGAEKSLDRGRSSETFFADFGISEPPIFEFSISRFRVLAISEFFRFQSSNDRKMVKGTIS